MIKLNHFHAIEVSTQQIKNYQKFNDAYTTFRKGIRPEYEVTKRIKNANGETIKAEFKKLGGVKGIYNKISNMINNTIDKILFNIFNT